MGLPGKGQQIPHDLRDPLGLLGDHLQIGALARKQGAAVLVFGHVAGQRQYAGDGIVDFVGHAAGQLPHRSQLRGLCQLVVGFLKLGILPAEALVGVAHDDSDDPRGQAHHDGEQAVDQDDVFPDVLIDVIHRTQELDAVSRFLLGANRQANHLKAVCQLRPAVLRPEARQRKNGLLDFPVLGVSETRQVTVEIDVHFSQLGQGAEFHHHPPQDLRVLEDIFQPLATRAVVNDVATQEFRQVHRAFFRQAKVLVLFHSGGDQHDQASQQDESEVQAHEDTVEQVARPLPCHPGESEQGEREHVLLCIPDHDAGWACQELGGAVQQESQPHGCPRHQVGSFCFHLAAQYSRQSGSHPQKGQDVDNQHGKRMRTRGGNGLQKRQQDIQTQQDYHTQASAQGPPPQGRFSPSQDFQVGSHDHKQPAGHQAVGKALEGPPLEPPAEEKLGAEVQGEEGEVKHQEEES